MKNEPMGKQQQQHTQRSLVRIIQLNNIVFRVTGKCNVALNIRHTLCQSCFF